MIPLFVALNVLAGMSHRPELRPQQRRPAVDEGGELEKKFREFLESQSRAREAVENANAGMRKIIESLDEKISRLKGQLDQLRQNGATENDPAVKNVKLALELFTHHRQMFAESVPKRPTSDKNPSP